MVGGEAALERRRYCHQGYACGEPGPGRHVLPPFSPVLDYFDLHSPDDLYAANGEYEPEANRRCFFSSLLGALGVPTYASSGYDWASAPSLWFDSATISTVGSLDEFAEDEQGKGSTVAAFPKYNGITKVLRSTSPFRIVPLEVISQGYTVGARARSWARIEDGELTLIAYRPRVQGGVSPLVSVVTDPMLVGAVQSKVAVVVGARGKGGITRSKDLAIVPYEGGEIAIRRAQGKRATAISHYFGGATHKQEVVISNGSFQVTAMMVMQQMPIEWIEVKITESPVIQGHVEGLDCKGWTQCRASGVSFVRSGPAFRPKRVSRPLSWR